MLDNKKTFIIAEAGVNHNGDIELAKKLIDVAEEAGADAIKFQTFISGDVISTKAKQAEYQTKNTGVDESQLEMVKKLELSFDDFEILYNYTKEKDIIFHSTAFDSKSMDFLVNTCKIPFIKVPSGEITNAKYLIDIAQYKLPMVISTGMANLEEIEQALAVLSYGWVNKDKPTSLKQCVDFYKTNEGAKALDGNVTILHCVTEYPAPYSDTNLNAMSAIKDKFNVPVGMSDHSLGIHIPIASVAMGAKVIEKHYTLDKDMQGPDHKASLNPSELKEMVKCIRDIEVAMGNGDKSAKQSEERNIPIARRSIVAKVDLKKGTEYSETNITCKRPGSGISAIKYWDLLGKVANSDVEQDELILGENTNV